MRKQSAATRLKVLGAVVGTGLSAATAETQAATLSYDTIALSGQSAPGSSTAFQAFYVPVVGGDGNVAFRAQVAGASTASGIWKHEAGSLGAVALVGAQAAGASDGVYAGLLDPVVNAAGDVMVRGSISTGLLQSDIAIWREDGGPLTLVARAGQALPGAPGLQFNSTINPAFSHSGAVAFQGTVNGLPSIVADGPGGFRLLAQTGAPVPGLSGHVFGPAPGGPMINGAGDVAFFASSGPAGGPRTTAVWLDSGGALTELARSGQTVAGFGVLSGFSGSPQINADGDVAFLASNTLARSALLRNDGGGIEVVAAHGQAAPGVGETFFSFGNPPSLNRDGAVAFRAFLTGDSGHDASVWRAAPEGVLELVAREGAAAPGAQSDVVFNAFGAPVLNGEGRLLFAASLRGSGVDAANDLGIWIEDLATGELLLVAREGDLFNVDGEMRTIGSLDVVSPVIAGDPSQLDFWPGRGDDGGRQLSLNDLGQFAFTMTFTDGSRGVFRAQVGEEPPLETPEPSALLVFAAGTLAAAAQSHRLRARPA